MTYDATLSILLQNLLGFKELRTTLVVYSLSISYAFIYILCLYLYLMPLSISYAFRA